MAIVFVSPDKKQKVFFWGITMLLVLFCITISFIVFSPEFSDEIQTITTGISYDKPDVTINLDIMDSAEVRSLEPFGNLETEFTYSVQDQHGKQINGNMLAATQDDAKKLLEGAGFIVLSIEKITVGRNDPFVPY